MTLGSRTRHAVCEPSQSRSFRDAQGGLAALLLASGLACGLFSPAAAQPGVDQFASVNGNQAAAGPLGCDPGERVLRFSHVVVAKGHPKGEAATALAEEINRRLNGRMCMQVYPSSALFDDSQVFPALLKGDVEFAAPSLSKFERYTKAFRIFDLPFLFSNERAVEWFQNTTPGHRLRRRLEGTGFRGLAFWNSGMKQFSATRPLLSPKDAAGLTFRVQKSRVLAEMIKALDAKAKPLPFKAVRDALSKGDVQGQENTWANIYSKEFFRYQAGATESNHGLLSYLVVTSDRFWNSLSKQERALLKQSLLKVSAQANARSLEIATRNRAALLRAGVEIRTLTPTQRSEWVQAMRPVWKRFANDIGQDLIDAAESSNR